jgi:hypothetical protein
MKKFVLFLLLIIPLFAYCQPEINTIKTHILKNRNLEIMIDMPLANYNFSRFDWTGKIVSVKYKGIEITSVEKMTNGDENNIGKGFYNEFGIDAAIGYDEIRVGDWFPKIGVGLLKKDNGDYLFSTKYDIQPAEFDVSLSLNKIRITCKSQVFNGYSYVLEKEIEIIESGFVIRYSLKNTGEKTITTNEYDHNFMAINKEFIGSDYILKFRFDMKPELFKGNVNPEKKVEIGLKEITFNGTPNEQFYFSNISGNEIVDANWELINTKSKIGISETGSFKTAKVNLWGWKHVISPELCFDIRVEPGKVIEWSRTYYLFNLN